jgi:signal transduction histidine kinase
MNQNASSQAHRVSALPARELAASVAWFIRLRWLAGVSVLGAVWFIDLFLPLHLPVLPLYLIGLIILAYNLVFRYAFARAPHEFSDLHRITHWQIACDWIAMSALIYFSGGLTSPAILYFFFHIIIASILLTARATFFFAAFATGLIGALGALELGGALPHVEVFRASTLALARDPMYVFGVIFFFASAAFVAAYLGNGLNQRLRERQAQTIQLNERLQTLYDAAQTINSTLELQQVLTRLARATAEAMNVRACSIRLLSDDGARLIVGGVHGLSDAYIQKGDLILAQNPLARQVLAGEVIAIADIANDTRLQYPAEAAAEGICAMLSAPLIGKHGPLGLMRAYSVERDHFTASDANFLTTIASQGSIAIENALAYQQLGKLDQMKSKFVLTVTHELRSPVSVVQSLLRTLHAGYAGALSETQRDAVERALRRSDFLQTLIDDLLALAAGKSELRVNEERVRVQLGDAVARVVERFQTPALEKQIALEWQCDCGDAPIAIRATQDAVDRILNNLVSNALKYTPTGGRVAITLRRADGNAQIEIVDTGIGIPDDAMPHLFEEFYRAPNAQQYEKAGTGLGLAITHDLVTRFGGRIAAHSKLNKGTTFVVTFPEDPKSL